MVNLQSKILNRMFRKVDGVVWDLSTNAIGLQNSNGIYTLTQSNEETGDSVHTVFGVSVNPFDSFGFPIPAYAQITPLDHIEVGDLVVGEKQALGWVTKVNPRSLTLLDQSGMQKNYTPPKVAVLNQDGALVVKSLVSLFGTRGAEGFSNALMPLLLAGGLGGFGGSDFGDILPLLLLTQQQAGDTGNALSSALPTILMMKAMSGRGSQSSGLDSLLLPLMLSGGLGGNGANGGLNPLLLLALRESSGGNTFISGGAPALSQSGECGGANAGVPPLRRV